MNNAVWMAMIGTLDYLTAVVSDLVPLSADNKLNAFVKNHLQKRYRLQITFTCDQERAVSHGSMPVKYLPESTPANPGWFRP